MTGLAQSERLSERSVGKAVAGAESVYDGSPKLLAVFVVVVDEDNTSIQCNFARSPNSAVPQDNLDDIVERLGDEVVHLVHQVVREHGHVEKDPRVEVRPLGGEL